MKILILIFVSAMSKATTLDIYFAGTRSLLAALRVYAGFVFRRLLTPMAFLHLASYTSAKNRKQPQIWLLQKFKIDKWSGNGKQRLQQPHNNGCTVFTHLQRICPQDQFGRHDLNTSLKLPLKKTHEKLISSAKKPDVLFS